MVKEIQGTGEMVPWIKVNPLKSEMLGMTGQKRSGGSQEMTGIHAFYPHIENLNKNAAHTISVNLTKGCL
jgi:hypothetical protein